MGGGVRAALACIKRGLGLHAESLRALWRWRPVTCDGDTSVASPQSFPPALAAYAVGADERSFLRSLFFAFNLGNLTRAPGHPGGGRSGFGGCTVCVSHGVCGGAGGMPPKKYSYWMQDEDGQEVTESLNKY